MGIPGVCLIDRTLSSVAGRHPCRPPKRDGKTVGPSAGSDDWSYERGGPPASAALAPIDRPGT
jgi:hypothetical protein